MKILKQIFAPGLASYGVVAYLKGNYKKTISRIEKAISWQPHISDEPVYNGYLGLALLKIGSKDRALPYLNKAVELFKTLKTTDNDEKEIYDELKNEIETALQNNT